MIDRTHDPALRSWIASAQAAQTDFPIQNLPFGVFSRPDEVAPRIGVAIGDQILDLRAVVVGGLLQGSPAAVVDACAEPTLNALMALGRGPLTDLRQHVSTILREESPVAADPALRSKLVVPQTDVAMHLPATVGDYTDFYASVHHAKNVGALFRPDNPLLPNYKWIPIGYHGRASSLAPDGAAIHRPAGQRMAPGGVSPTMGPSQSLDYELELGVFVGRGNALGEHVPLAEAEAHLFGVCLLNDWSARDIQAWEYQPLGPFLGKSFATTISPWVVTLDALEPFRSPSASRPEGDPQPLPYLTDVTDRERGAFDIVLDISITTRAMRASGHPPLRLGRASAAELYWTVGQMVAHHTVNGCNLRPGDLLATGTLSGPRPDALGCLLELTRRGTVPIEVHGESRSFLQDGDEVTITAFCERAGAARIGFGTCRGRIVG